MRFQLLLFAALLVTAAIATTDGDLAVDVVDVSLDPTHSRCCKTKRCAAGCFCVRGDESGDDTGHQIGQACHKCHCQCPPPPTPKPHPPPPPPPTCCTTKKCPPGCKCVNGDANGDEAELGDKCHKCHCQCPPPPAPTP